MFTGNDIGLFFVSLDNTIPIIHIFIRNILQIHNISIFTAQTYVDAYLRDASMKSVKLQTVEAMAAQERELLSEKAEVDSLAKRVHLRSQVGPRLGDNTPKKTDGTSFFDIVCFFM